MSKTRKIRDIVVISDTHFGSTLGLCPPKHRLDDGGYYLPSNIQQKLWAYWQDFWCWTYARLNGQPFAIVHNGDLIDGDHHNTPTIISRNLKDQEHMAINVMQPHVQKAAMYFQLRGTEVHAGQAAACEERIAATLGAVQDSDTGAHSTWELGMELGPEIIHFSHHIGTTTSTAYEASAPMREITAAFVEAGQWGNHPPTVLVRSHRHRYIEVKPANCRIVVTPAWQAKTPFVFKMDRMRSPMFGGLIIRLGDEGVHIRERIYTLTRPIDVKL
jgi:hypothetical protein